MKLNVPNGWIAHLNLTTIAQVLLSRRGEVQQIVQRERDAWLAGQAARIIDVHRVYLEGLPDNPFAYAVRKLAEYQTGDKALARGMGACFDAEVCLYPRTAAAPLVIVNSEQSGVQAWFGDLWFVQSYAYWDQGDRPMAIQSREWKERRHLWHRAIPDPQRPFDKALRLTLVDQERLPEPKIEDVFDRLPSMEQRARSLALLRHMNEVLSDMPLEKRWDGLAGGTSIIKAQADADEARRAELVRDALSRLTPITFDDLMKA